MAAASATRGEVSRAQVEEGIAQGVEFLIGRQEADGHWGWKPGEVPDERFKVGQTALVVLALQHSGSKRPEVQLAIKKGLSYILQQPAETMTYSAGVVEQVLYFDSPTAYPGPVSAYAWMVCGGQKREGPLTGSWGYELPKLPQGWQSKGVGTLQPLPGLQKVLWSDNSNGQFAILALTFAQRAGFQVPRVVWENARAYYTAAQHKDGGWDYFSDQYRATLPENDERRKPPAATMSMTLAGTVSIYLCDEMLADKGHKVCKTPASNESHEAGLKWIGEHWAPRMGMGSYGWYAAERLGLLIGYSEFGGHDWYQQGVEDVIPVVGDMSNSPDWWGSTAKTSFAVLFLSRGRNPIIINKLKREGDWNLHRYDLSHLTDYISGPGQKPCQWRIVTLTAPVDYLLKVPMLWISGHDALAFTAEGKAKLKEYVEKGGTILAEDCCSKKPFDESFRAMLKEFWPDKELTEVPKTHEIYTSYRKVAGAPTLLGLTVGGGEERLGVIYLPKGISCKWEAAGPDSRAMMDMGMDIYLHVDKAFKQMKAEAAEKDKPM